MMMDALSLLSLGPGQENTVTDVVMYSHNGQHAAYAATTEWRKRMEYFYYEEINIEKKV